MQLLLLLVCALALTPPQSLTATPTTPSAAADASPSLAVGTLNIRYATASDGANAWEHRRDMVNAIVQHGDFWGLQEALPEQVKFLAAANPAYELLVRTREADPAQGEACPIFYRSAKWSIDPTEQGTFWLSLTPEVAGSKSWDSSLPRICTFARFTERAALDASANSARSVYIFNTHFDHQGATARLEAAKIILERIAARAHDDPVLLLGDFNSDPTSEPIALASRSTAPRLIDAWRAIHPTAPEQGTFNGWSDSCGSRRIDFIFATPALTPLTCAIDLARPNGRWPSDHVPVRASFAFPAPDAAARRAPRAVTD